MPGYLRHIILKAVRNQWCFVAVFALFTFLCTGEDYRHEVAARQPVPAAQTAKLILPAQLPFFNADLQKDVSDFAVPSASFYHLPSIRPDYFFENKINTLYKHQRSISLELNPRPYFYQTRLPEPSDEGSLSDLFSA